MSRDELQELLTDLAGDVTRANLVLSAVARARTVRRRRRVLGAATVTAVVLAFSAVALWGPDLDAAPPTPAASNTRGSAGNGDIQVDRLPDPIPAALPSPTWPDELSPTVQSSTLESTPLAHAFLLSEAGGVVYAFGQDAHSTIRWVRLPVDLDLRQTSLGPMGRQAALVRADGALVVVDLSSGAVAPTDLPTPVGALVWLSDGRHLLAEAGAKTWLVNVETGTRTTVSADVDSVTPLVGDGDGLTTLTLAAPSNEPVVHRYDDAGSTVDSSHPVSIASLAPYRIDTLIPTGWRYGPYIAQMASGQNGSTPTTFAILVDEGRGRIERLLDLGGAGCCSVLGWENQYEVIVHNAQSGILRWNISDGTVSRVTPPTTGVVSVAPVGCGWQVTIEDVTATCIA